VYVVREVTESRLAAEAATRQGEVFHTIMDSIEGAVLIRDEALELTYCSPAFEKMLSWHPDEMLQVEGLRRHIHPDDVEGFMAASERFARHGGVLDVESRARSRDGGWRWYRNRAVAARSAKRQYVCIIDDVNERKEAQLALVRAHDELEERVRERTAELGAAKRALEADIEARKRAEADKARLERELRKSQTLEAVGQLAGGVAHDFNNLLGGVLGCLYAARMSLPHGSEALEELDRAKQLCKRGGDLTRQLLTVARRRTGCVESVEPDSLLDEARLLLERTLPKHIRLVVAQESDVPAVRADRSLLLAALLNLGLNARDAMPNGGTLTLSCRRDREPDGRPTALLDVSDTGAGISKTLQEKIFEPFFTTKPSGEGSGLGLSMVYATVQDCGGEISVRSAPGEGATFTLRLPGAAPSLRAAAGLTEVVRGRHPLIGGSVLVVEDEDDVARLVVDVLERHGYECLRAADGIEALELFRDHYAAVGLVALDLMLPEMGGEEVYRFVTSLVPDVPVLLITGRPDVARSFAPHLPLVPKPFTDEEFLDGVAAVLGAGRAATA
jgi:PAS domain S-box-containing protein